MKLNIHQPRSGVKLKIFQRDATSRRSRGLEARINFASKYPSLNMKAIHQLGIENKQELLFAQDEESQRFYVAVKPESGELSQQDGFTVYRSEKSTMACLSTVSHRNKPYYGKMYRLNTENPLQEQGLNWYEMESLGGDNNTTKKSKTPKNKVDE